jgi:hypothetical protein
MGLASITAASLSAESDVATTLTDEFLITKMLSGWKPNQFVEGPAKQFLASPK